MVKPVIGSVGRFRTEERGISVFEGLITFPIVLLMLVAMAEFGFAVHQWNQTVKAVQIGARLAVVSEPLADLTPISNYYTNNGVVGQPPPSGAPTVTCGAGTSACDATQLNRLVFGSDSTCDPEYGSSRPGICDFHRGIGPGNLRITYSPSGLGFVGSPGKPVVTVTLEVRGLRFNLPFLGALIGVNTMEIPSHPVALTSEDLSNVNS